jgi:hypothetical protein
MKIFDDIAERRIQAAQDAGEFDRLPGMGRPLVISEDFSMPIEVRMAHRRLLRAAQEDDRFSLAAQLRMRRLWALVEQRRAHLRRLGDTAQRVDITRPVDIPTGDEQ